MNDKITITANGETQECDSQSSIVDFLTGKGLNPDCVVVELNKEALTPSEAKNATLNDGDVLEVVRIVAGG